MATIIAFSGTDGAGKSTQIELLVKRARANGIPVSVIWARGGYTPVFSLLKKLVRIVGRSTLPPSGDSLARSRKFGSSIVRRGWLVLAILDLALLYGVWLRLLSVGKGYVLCDRYLEDTRLDFDANFPGESVNEWKLWKLLEWCAPVPAHRFLLIVPPAVSLERSKLKGEPFPDPMEVLVWRYDRYRERPSENWKVIDARELPEVVHERIVKGSAFCG